MLETVEPGAHEAARPGDPCDGDPGKSSPSRRGLQGKSGGGRTIHIRRASALFDVAVEPHPHVKRGQPGLNRRFDAHGLASSYATVLNCCYSWPIRDDSGGAALGINPSRYLSTSPIVYVTAKGPGSFEVSIAPQPWAKRVPAQLCTSDFRAEQLALRLAHRHRRKFGPPLRIVREGC